MPQSFLKLRCFGQDILCSYESCCRPKNWVVLVTTLPSFPLTMPKTLLNQTCLRRCGWIQSSPHCFLNSPRQNSHQQCASSSKMSPWAKSSRSTGWPLAADCVWQCLHTAELVRYDRGVCTIEVYIVHVVETLVEPRVDGSHQIEAFFAGQRWMKLGRQCQVRNPAL